MCAEIKLILVIILFKWLSGRQRRPLYNFDAKGFNLTLVESKLLFFVLFVYLRW